jgi:hypothetical protein
VGTGTFLPFYLCPISKLMHFIQGAWLLMGQIMWLQSTSLLVLVCGQSDAHPLLFYCFYFYCEKCWLVVSLNPSELKKYTIPGLLLFILLSTFSDIY